MGGRIMFWAGFVAGIVCGAVLVVIGALMLTSGAASAFERDRGEERL
jgi:hypothetical protein